MKCDQCNDTIDVGEEKEHHSRVLCEDCYMDALSPAQACDPWAVYLAKSSSTNEKGTLAITDIQAKILRYLEETGGTEPEVIAQRLKLTLSDLKREAATLRHMEKIRGENRDGKIVLRLW